MEKKFLRKLRNALGVDHFEQHLIARVSKLESEVEMLRNSVIEQTSNKK